MSSHRDLLHTPYIDYIDIYRQPDRKWACGIGRYRRHRLGSGLGSGRLGQNGFQQHEVQAHHVGFDGLGMGPHDLHR